MGQFLSKAKLSGSTDGKPILVVATSTPGTAIHTAVAGTGDDNFDEVWLWAQNTDSSNRKLTIEYGGTTVGFLLEKTITLEDGLYLIVPGLLMQNSGAIAAFAAAASVVSVWGYVNKIRPT